MALAIEREWGKSPGWFASLDVDDHVRLIADWRVRHVPAKKPLKVRK